jgi:GTPase
MSEAGAHRSGFIALVGRPNVGKSTLLNQILGEKIAIISDKPQTTRTRILGVRHLPKAQLVFLDTPGIHKPLYRLNQRMVRVALEVLDEVDLVFFLVEATEGVGGGDRYVVERLKERAVPAVLVINKVDLVQKGRLLPLIDAYRQMHEFAEIVPISALTGDGVNRLVDIAVRFMPVGPVYFEDDIVTDQPMQLLAAEFIREKILQKTRDELPFSVAVQIESFIEEEARFSERRSGDPLQDSEATERVSVGPEGEGAGGEGRVSAHPGPGKEEAVWASGREGDISGAMGKGSVPAGPGHGKEEAALTASGRAGDISGGIAGRKRGKRLARVSAIVYVEKESQKAIVIGKRGELLKAVGTEARIEMERLFGMKVFLQLWVKVKEGWRQDEQMLSTLGY